MVFIFNPDTEMALASGQASYTPPAGIRSRITRLALLPALFAPEGSAIATDEPEAAPASLASEAERRGMRIISFSDIRNTSGEIRPWGWNRQLVSRLGRDGVDAGRLPSAAALDKLRELAHRRTASKVNAMLGCEAAAEFFDTVSALRAISVMGNAVVKSPWSSSGRGVIFSRLTPPGRLIDAVHGIIRRQGSVMVEAEAERVRDFASEWECSDGHASYVGFSAFATRDGGAYAGNMVDCEEVLRGQCPQFTPEVLERQRMALDRLVAPYYSGPLGIDMLVDASERLHPCVEINLRTTMGHVALAVWRRTGRPSVLNAWTL